VIDESLLDWMELAVLGETLDRRHLRPLGGCGENQAAVHPPSVQMHGASAALTEVTALLGTGQLQVLAQQIEQCGARINWDLVAAAIDAQHDRQMRTKFHVLTPQRLAIFTEARAFSLFNRTFTSCLAPAFEQEPDASFGFVNPVFEHTHACYIVYSAAHKVRVAHKAGKALVVAAQLCKHL